MNRRLHVLGLPWTQTTKEYLTCAYTQKVVKFCGMMEDEGYEVVLYSGEENEARCTQHVPIITEAERLEWFGPNDQNDAFSKISWELDDPWWVAFNERATDAIAENAEKQDFLCLTTSRQEPIALCLPDILPVEWAVGYDGILLGDQKWRIFESYAWMHYVYGKTNTPDGASFDAVIPNFFDPADFPVQTQKDDYLLFIGRIVSRKGPHVAAQIAQRAGRKLIVAGPGATGGKGKVESPEISFGGEHVEYVGPVGVEDRAELMGKAAAVIAPTQYIEPFGGVAVEAMLCGTPVVASDWGAFTETVPNGIGGYRFRTLREGVEAVEAATLLDPEDVRAHALLNYSLGAVGPQFDEHFQRLETLWHDGWAA